jgi:tRNA (adenine57-N1/adenine58-N1)-methyltransferase catalytic subunit
VTDGSPDQTALDGPLETESAGAPEVAAESDVATVMSRHRGPFRAGDLVQLTDAKSRKHTVDLAEGKTFFTHKGAIAHDDLIGSPEGVIVHTDKDVPYLALRPLLSDFTVAMPRGAAVVYPKDAAAIVGSADIFPGAVVVEAGAGSGALSCSLLRAVGEHGRLVSFERREEFAAVAERNVRRFLTALPDTWTLRVGDLADTPVVRETLTGLRLESADRFMLDMLAPWECLDTAAALLMPGGVLCAYIATTTQLSRMAESLREHGGFTEPSASELMLRTWHVEGLAVRPDHRMIGHTGFLLLSRRLAPGHRPLRRQRRPAPGAYGGDYTGPRPADVLAPEQE